MMYLKSANFMVLKLHLILGVQYAFNSYRSQVIFDETVVDSWNFIKLETFLGVRPGDIKYERSKQKW